MNQPGTSRSQSTEKHCSLPRGASSSSESWQQTTASSRHEPQRQAKGSSSSLSEEEDGPGVNRYSKSFILRMEPHQGNGFLQLICEEVQKKTPIIMYSVLPFWNFYYTHSCHSLPAPIREDTLGCIHRNKSFMRLSSFMFLMLNDKIPGKNLNGE